jgi:hypothetical protein
MQALSDRDQSLHHEPPQGGSLRTALGALGWTTTNTPPLPVSAKKDQVMSKQAFTRLPIVPGQASVESRVAVWTICPLCQQEHRHILTAQDHLELPGSRYWCVDCRGGRYLLEVSASSIADALTLAAEIAAAYGLTQRWLTQNIAETACPCTAMRR